MIFLLLVVLLLLFPMVLVMLLPVGFGVQSVASLVTMPAQILAVARDGRRRRNHALEHATVNILEQHYGTRVQFGGLAERDGFLIMGAAANPEVILAAAREGLSRLKAGEWRLALHPRCGTTLVSGQLIAALTFLTLVLLTKQLSIVWVLVALAVAWWWARPLSLFLQRFVTTSADVRSVYVDDIVSERPTNLLALMIGGGRPTRFKIRTHEFAISSNVETSTPAAPRRYRAY
ncbi:MAG: DUF6391 domain-containing protein [Ardenticatenaceae bacterium]|nr:DUF6391 domain-containing protein [Ardenticatenaceae bacterium]